MNGPLAVETHLRGGTRVVLALFQIAKLKRDTINDINACGTCRSHSLGFGVVIERELLAHGIACADAAGIIHDAENQTSQTRR